MKIKEILLTGFWTILAILLLLSNYITNNFVLKADNVFKVYLDGKIVGYIKDDDELYNLINKRQSEIMKKYGVKKVYPPENFEIVETNSYTADVSTVEEIYNRMAEINTFTIDGYIITVKEDKKDDFTINVLNKEMFDNAINYFVRSFIDENDYDNYINDTQKEIETTGKIINLMYFDQTLTIKKGFISVDDKIYIDENDLVSYLFFGKDYKINSYEVKVGDTIESISEANKLNPEEFLVANPKYTSKDSLLVVGDKVNITILNPVLTYTYEATEVSDVEVAFDSKIVYDSNKSPSYSEITTPGVTGITRQTSNYIVKNGEMQSGVVISDSKVIIQKIDQVTTKGRPNYNGGGGTYIDDGSSWGWPTLSNYIITSCVGYRWGALHEGVDISGTGYGSPIFASLDGTVAAAGYGGMVGSVAGYNVVIEHDNGYYTVYAHMVPGSILVSTGQRVNKGQRIGSMGMSGVATGTHLHFGLYYGMPYHGGKLLNPCTLWPGSSRCQGRC